MSLLRTVQFRLRHKDSAYTFQAHPNGSFAVTDAAATRFEPAFGGVRVRSGWMRGNRFRRYAENIGRTAREPAAWKDFRTPHWARHLNEPTAVIDVLTGKFRPFTPVLLIDGRPAATGFGEGVVVVPAGRHLVQLQSGASGPYRVVDVPDGGTVDLDAVTTRRRNLRAMEGRPNDAYADMALGPRGQVGVRDGWQHRSYMTGAATGAVVIAVLAVLGAFGVGPGLDLRSPATVVPLAVAVFGAMAVRAVAESLRRNPVGEPFLPDPSSQFVHRVLDPGDTASPQESPGRAVLRVHAVYRQDRHRKDAGPGKPTGTSLKALSTDKRALRRRDNWEAAGEPAAPKVRPWAAPPIVRANGRELPAVWGLNEYQLPPGDYRVEIAVPEPPRELVTDTTEVKLGKRALVQFTLPVRPGQPAAVGAYARLRCTPARKGTTLSEYRGMIRPA